MQPIWPEFSPNWAPWWLPALKSMLGEITLNGCTCHFSALSWLYPAHRPGLQLRRGHAEFRNQRGEWYSISMLSLPETTETNRALASVREPGRPNKAQTQLSIFLTRVRTERENMCLSSILSWNSYLHFKVGRGELCFADKREQTADRKQSSVASFLQERPETWNSFFFSCL